MKNTLLFFLLLLLISPTISFGAEMTTLEIEFAFPLPDYPEKQLSGYKLYKEGAEVCETFQPDVSRIICDLPTEQGAFNFTLSACYSDGTESPQSPAFPFTISSSTLPPPESQGSKTITYSWDKNSFDSNIAGYRMYINDSLLCQKNEPSATSLSCNTNLLNGVMAFSIASFDSNGSESLKSNILVFDPSSTPELFPANNVTFNWNYANSIGNEGGFRFYSNGDFLCSTTDPSARELTCQVNLSNQTNSFTMTAVDAHGLETALSNALTYSNATSATPPTAVVSSSAAVGEGPLTVTFDGSASTTANPPIVSYSWAFGDGSHATGKTATHTFTEVGTSYTELTVTDSVGLTNKVNTPVIVTKAADSNETPTADDSAILPEGDGPITVSPDDNVPAAESIKLEVGEVSIDHQWVKVLFDNTFTDPVVIAGPLTYNGNDPSTVRIRNIDKVGFEIRLQEWNYLDGSHIPETIHYIVIDKGIHTLDNGSKIEAGSFTGSTTFKQVSLQQPFNITPVILTQVMTENEADAVTGRINTVSQSSFDFRLQEQEATPDIHTTETVGYLAWEPGKGEISGLLYEARNTTKSVTSNWYTLTFQTEFTDLPLFIAGMQTYAGADTAAVRMQKMSKTAVQVKIEEEQSLDAEVGHTAEVVGYLSISTANKEVLTRLATFSWEFDSSQEKSISGFSVYNNDQLVCETTNPEDRTLTCEMEMSLVGNSFSIKAKDISGSETDASNSLKYKP